MEDRNAPVTMNALGFLPLMGVAAVAFGVANAVAVASLGVASPWPGTSGKILFGIVLALPALIPGALLALAVTRLRIDPGARTVEVEKGVRPFVRTRRTALDAWKEVRIGMVRTKNGAGFNVYLVPKEGRRTLLALWAGRRRIERAIELGERLGLPVVADPRQARLAPAWLRSRVPRLFDAA